MKHLIVLLIIFLAVQSFAQRDAAAKAKDSARYNFIIVDSKYQNQFAFWGRDYNQKLPYLATTVMYYTHSGLWMSASNFEFFNNMVPTQFGLSMGYFKELSQKVDWHVSYSQFYVPGQDVPSGYRTQGYAQTTFGFDWGPLFTTIQAHALLNQHSDVFLTSTSSRYFEFNQLWFKKVKVSFEPKFSFTFGTHHFEYANGLVIAPGGGGIVSQGNASDSTGGQFQMLNFDFTIPVKFAVGYFSFEPSWRYTLPVNANPDYNPRGLSILAVGVNYYIPFKR